MANNYITQSEEWILSHLPAGRFHAEDRQLYHDHVSPRIIRGLLSDYDYEDALAFMDYVIARVQIRLDRAKDRRLRYELTCYLSWLANIRAQIENDYAPDRAVQRHIGFMEAVKRIVARQAHP